MTFVRNYDAAKKSVKKANAVCVYDICIAGEGVAGVFSYALVMSLLRLHIVNDTFHPYLFRYLCGTSIGTWIIDSILKIWFLYETQPDKQIALDFIDATYSSLNFDDIRNLIARVDDVHVLNLTNWHKCFTNFISTGGTMSRSGIKQCLRLDNAIFVPFKPYFNTDAFFKWRKPHLDNVFISVQSTESHASIIFTGNPRLIDTPSKLIKFVKMTNENFEYAILSSSGLPLAFESLKIDGVEGTVDGSSFVRNIIHVPQMLHNFSYYNNVEQVFTPVLNFFNINTNDFVIHNDVINTQTYFESVNVVPYSSIAYINSIYTYYDLYNRMATAVYENFDMSIVAYTQPIIAEFSTNDANEIKGASRDYNSEILHRHANVTKVLDVNLHDTHIVEDYSLIISKLPLSSYVYDLRAFSHNGRSVHLMDTNTFVRTLYPISSGFVAYEIPFNLKTQENVRQIELCRNSGVIQGSVMYDIHKKRMNMKWNKLSKVIQIAYDKFLGT